MVDLVAHENIGVNERLSKTERYALASVLHNACVIENTKMNILSAVAEMCESLKRIIYDGTDEELATPMILPIDRMDGITE